MAASAIELKDTLAQYEAQYDQVNIFILFVCFIFNFRLKQL